MLVALEADALPELATSDLPQQLVVHAGRGAPPLTAGVFGGEVPSGLEIVHASGANDPSLCAEVWRQTTEICAFAKPLTAEQERARAEEEAMAHAAAADAAEAAMLASPSKTPKKKRKAKPAAEKPPLNSAMKKQQMQVWYSNVGRLFCTPAPPKFTKKLAVDSFFNFGS